MGQCISVPHRKLSLMREGSARSFYKSKSKNLSATFHVLDSNLRWDLLNVNIATAEELMTLPGINRVIAENVVEYRQKINGFRKVEDLALVSGVGATKLEQFRTEVCIGKRKGNGSYNSSLTQSLESLHVADAPSRNSPLKLVNVNTANVFQLMSVCRMTQEMAANIVHYRERKGPFKSLNDLLKVKGLPPDRMAIVKMYLTVEPSSETENNNTVNNNNKKSHNPSSKSHFNHRRTNSAPCGFGKSRTTHCSTRDFYELISLHVTRPPIKEFFSFSRDGKPALRISSWNLQKFVLDKARNPGVREVICQTILENGLSLVAVQEVSSKESLSLIASELNDPHLYNVQNWEGERGKWHSLVPPPTAVTCDNSHRKVLSNGFLYDTSQGLQLRDSTVLYLSPDIQKGLSISCQPFLGWFRIENLDFVVVTFSLISEICVAKLLPSILELLRERIPGEKNVFLVGDFILPPGHTVFEVLSSQGYSHLIPSEAYTNSATKQEDSHLWASTNVRKLYTGHSGVITEGLSHLMIPDGWQWGGRVSDHCPIWAEIFTKEDAVAFTDVPFVNGIQKVSSSAEETDANEAKIKKKLPCKKDKSFWSGNFMWKHNNKDGITCGKKNGTVKENNAV